MLKRRLRNGVSGGKKQKMTDKKRKYRNNDNGQFNYDSKRSPAEHAFHKWASEHNLTTIVKGFPDSLVISPTGEISYVEVKAKHDYLTVAQLIQGTLLTLQGIDYRISDGTGIGRHLSDSELEDGKKYLEDINRNITHKILRINGLPSLDKALTTNECANLLHIQQTDVYKLIKTGKIKAIRMFNKYMIPPQEITREVLNACNEMPKKDKQMENLHVIESRDILIEADSILKKYQQVRGE